MKNLVISNPGYPRLVGFVIILIISSTFLAPYSLGTFIFYLIAVCTLFLIKVMFYFEMYILTLSIYGIVDSSTVI